MAETRGGRPVVIGVLGANSWIANQAVVPAVRASAKATLGSLGSRTGPVGYDDVLNDANNDAVYIALPNAMHRYWTERAAAAGKHVLCEKPIATSVVDADAMSESCRTAGVVLAEAYMTSFHPRSKAIAEHLASGALGAIRQIDAAFTFPLADESNYRWLPEQGGGALLDVGVYCLAPILQTLGATGVTVDAHAVMSPSNVDATTSFTLNWPRGARANVTVSFELPERQWFHVAGTQGSIAVNRPFTPGPNDMTYDTTALDGAQTTIRTLAANSYALMVDAFADAVTGANPWPRSFNQVRDVVSVCEQVAARSAEQQ